MVDQISIRPLASSQDMLDLQQLQRLIWPSPEADIVPLHVLLALVHNGGMVMGAFIGDQMVGFVVGFLGTDAQTPDRPAMARLKLCSHMLGVHPDYWDRGIGYQLKLAQRREAIEQGLRLVTWTYDPLESRNAQLNLRRLGAICRIYRREAYGQMADDLNRGIPSDRFLVEWWVTSRRVVARLEGKRPQLDWAHYVSAGAKKIVSSCLSPSGLPQPVRQAGDLEGAFALVEIPSDFQLVKHESPELALEWRLVTREVFEETFDRGYMVTDLVRIKDETLPRSYYVLTYGEAAFG